MSEPLIISLLVQAHLMLSVLITVDLNPTTGPLHRHPEDHFFHDYGACSRTGETRPKRLILLTIAGCLLPPASADGPVQLVEYRHLGLSGLKGDANRGVDPSVLVQCVRPAARREKLCPKQVNAWRLADRVDLLLALKHNVPPTDAFDAELAAASRGTETRQRQAWLYYGLTRTAVGSWLRRTMFSNSLRLRLAATACASLIALLLVNTTIPAKIMLMLSRDKMHDGRLYMASQPQ